MLPYPKLLLCADLMPARKIRLAIRMFCVWTAVYRQQCVDGTIKTSLAAISRVAKGSCLSQHFT